MSRRRRHRRHVSAAAARQVLDGSGESPLAHPPTDRTPTETNTLVSGCSAGTRHMQLLVEPPSLKPDVALVGF